MMQLSILNVLEGRSICWTLIYILLILAAEVVGVVVVDLVAVVVHVVQVVLLVMERLGLGWVAQVMLEVLV
jgi:hypothetical protein